jgi:hypothetical protein
MHGDTMQKKTVKDSTIKVSKNHGMEASRSARLRITGSTDHLRYYARYFELLWRFTGGPFTRFKRIH